jgi:hypothetical protein
METNTTMRTTNIWSLSSSYFSSFTFRSSKNRTHSINQEASIKGDSLKDILSRARSRFKMVLVIRIRSRK